MSPGAVTVFTFGMLLSLIGLGIPLGFSTLATAIVVGTTVYGFDSLLIIVGRIYDASTNYVLITVPLFIMMGVLMERGGIANRLCGVLHLWSSRLPGGMALGCVFAGAIMAAMVGIVGAEVITLGLVALPAMMKRGYDQRITLGVICASGSLGALIPPSLVLVFYGLIAGVSIAELYAAALVPGLVLAFCFAVYIGVRCWFQPHLAPPPPAEELALPLLTKLALGKNLILPIGIVLAVLGSLYFGIAAPTEAAAIGAAGALFAVIVSGNFRVRDIHEVLIQTGKSIGPVMWTFFGATGLIGIYAFTGGIAYMSNLIAGLPLPPMGIIAVMMFILVLLGMVVDWVGIALLTMPVFVPVIRTLGYDPIWFGVLFCVNMQIGYLSPPFGSAAFYLKSVTPPEITLGQIFGSVWPFVTVQIFVLILVMFFPSLALWLPAQMR